MIWMKAQIGQNINLSSSIKQILSQWKLMLRIYLSVPYPYISLLIQRGKLLSVIYEYHLPFFLVRRAQLIYNSNGKFVFWHTIQESSFLEYFDINWTTLYLISLHFIIFEKHLSLIFLFNHFTIICLYKKINSRIRRRKKL